MEKVRVRGSSSKEHKKANKNDPSIKKDLRPKGEIEVEETKGRNEVEAGR